jgi:hypothetical protein
MRGMSLQSRWLCLLALGSLCALRVDSAHAEIYRCTIDGRLTFRDAPCPGQPAPPPGSPIQPGCYQVDYAGWESGRQLFIVKIDAAADGKLRMTEPGDASKSSLPMRRASADELRSTGRLLGFAADSGLVMEVPAGTPNQPALPIGLYRGRNPYRDASYFFYGFLANGFARPVACP